MGLILEKGRPEDTSGRLDKEIRCYDLLDRLGVEYWRVDHPAAFTMEACLEIDGALGTAMCKNLLLTNRQHTARYLLLMPGDKVFKTKELSSQINSARLSFASGEEMEKYLDITPGSLSILGLMNDRGHAVAKLVLNEAIRPGTLVYPKSWQSDQHLAGGWSEPLNHKADPVLMNQSFMDVRVAVRAWNE